MKRKWILVVLAVFLSVLVVACQSGDTQSADETPGAPEGGAQLPNPAAVYCQEQGHNYEIRTASDGSQSGVCIFADGSECDEWAYYRGECEPESGGQ